MNYTSVTTPVGPLWVVATDAGAIAAAGFTADLTPQLPIPLVATARRRSELGDITKAVTSYLDGDLAAIDALPVEQPIGGDFVAAAWRALRTIRPGAPLTYAQLAVAAGRPAAIRAAASACARNAVALFVPCHRVLRSDGGWGGYRWGVPVKRWLLAHERAAALTGGAGSADHAAPPVPLDTPALPAH